MPIIKITTYKNKIGKNKHNLVNSIKNSIKNVFQINHDNFHFYFNEMDDESLIVPEMMRNNYIMIEIRLFPGKDKIKKYKLYNLIEKELEKINYLKNDIIINIEEPIISNWFIRGKTGDDIIKS